jgi:hypothetical protein
VFLHLVGCAGHVVHSVAPRARNVDTLLFMFGWDRFGFNEKRVRTRYAELVFWHPEVRSGHETSTHGAQQTQQKDDRDMLRQTCVFVSVGICGSRSAFWCVRGMKCRCTIFHARLGPVLFP